jgi:hypothetical protein
MTILAWFRSPPKRAPASPRKRPTPAPTTAPPSVEELTIEARELSSAWRPGDGHMVLSTPSSVGRGRRVSVKISGVTGVAARVHGQVASVRVSKESCHAEVLVDEDGRLLLGRILEFLRGGEETLKVRPPRYRISLPAVVSWASGHSFMKTVSLSQGGCGLAWSGMRPQVGSGIYLRLGAAPRQASFRGKVCWVREAKNGVRVGVRFLAGDEPGLAALLAEARLGPAEG